MGIHGHTWEYMGVQKNLWAYIAVGKTHFFVGIQKNYGRTLYTHGTPMYAHVRQGCAWVTLWAYWAYMGIRDYQEF